jgi:hypothetical protein
MADASLPDIDDTFSPLLPLGPDPTPYRLVTDEGVATFDTPEGTFLKVAPDAITRLTAEAMHDIAHFLRPGHLQQLRNILDDPEASPNDRFVATDLLKNAAISAGGVLPMCQDTGTAIVKAKKGQFVFTGRRRRARDRPRCAADLPHQQPALQPAGAAHDVRREEHRHQPAGRDQDRSHRRRRVHVPVHGQGRRQRQQELPLPGDQGAAERGDAAAVAVREAAVARHRGVPAVPPGRGSAAPRPSSRSRPPSSPRPATSTRSPPRARCSVTGSATSSSRPRCCISPRPPASAPSSAASTSATTCGSSASPATVRAARWPSRCRARPTARRSARSPRRHLPRELERDPARFLPDVTHDDLEDEAVVHVDLTRPMSEIRAELSKYPVRPG